MKKTILLIIATLFLSFSSYARDTSNWNWWDIGPEVEYYWNWCGTYYPNSERLDYDTGEWWGEKD